MKFIKSKSPKDNSQNNTNESKDMSKDISQNISKIKNDFGNSSDIVINVSKNDNAKNIQYASIYLKTNVDKRNIDALSLEIIEVIKSLENTTPEKSFNIIEDSLTSFRESTQGNNYSTLYKALLSGHTIFLIDGCSKFFSINTYLPEGRSVEEPTSQSIIRGPKESFTENIRINIGLIRKRIKNKALIINEQSLGSITSTKISVMHIEGIAKKEIVDEINRRLNTIQIDGILDSHYIEELIKDDRYSIFPTFLSSEKPDSVCAGLLEGKVAILVDGSPYVLTAPALFIDFIQSSEDYYHNYVVASMFRIVRVISLILTLLVPAAYVALITFHQEMVPTPLLISIASQRDAVPFPALIEALLMEVTFEILKEAGIRMPRVIGPAISIVGTLVLGQAAVEAGIVSAAMVIIVSITAISSFAIPNYSMSNSIRLLRFILMFLAGGFGIYGIFMGIIALILHLCKLKSIGVPYLTPISPVITSGNKDTFLRFPLWSMKLRPVTTSSNSSPRVDDEDPVGQEQKEKPEFG